MTIVKTINKLLKNQRNSLLIVFLIALCSNQGCTEILPTAPSLVTLSAPVTLTANNTPKPTKMPTTTSVPTITPTPVSTGVFVLFFYEPLEMNYDPSIWEDRSNYAEWGVNLSPPIGVIINNYLQALRFKICQIGVIGPSGFFPSPQEIIQLGNVRYQFSTLENKELGVKIGHYIEDQSLTNYGYDRYGLPVVEIAASPSEWSECKTLGEDVLSTLHIP